MGRAMGWDFGLESPNLCFPKKNRWLFKIKTISADGVNALPPSKSARPSISFKEMEVQHLTETIYFPQKADWKPVNLTLYEPAERVKTHPVFEWLKQGYNPDLNGEAVWRPPVTEERGNLHTINSFKLPEARLELYDGCGEIIQTWVYEGVWPQAIEFGDLDMNDSGITTVDLTLRYDRAYLI